MPITIGLREITHNNVANLDIDFGKVLDRIRKESGLTLEKIAGITDIGWQKIKNASSRKSAKFCKCERMALLELYQEHYDKDDIQGIFK